VKSGVIVAHWYWGNDNYNDEEHVIEDDMLQFFARTNAKYCQTSVAVNGDWGYNGYSGRYRVATEIVSGYAIPCATVEDLETLYRSLTSKFSEDLTTLVFQFLNIDWTLPKLSIGVNNEVNKKKRKKAIRKERRKQEQLEKRKRKTEGKRKKKRVKRAN
jgi:hypothetical protein